MKPDNLLDIAKRKNQYELTWYERIEYVDDTEEWVVKFGAIGNKQLLRDFFRNSIPVQGNIPWKKIDENGVFSWRWS